MPAPLNAVILISGRGSNMQAIIDQARAGTLPVRICAVISDRPGAPGLARAREAGIPAEAVEPAAHGDKAAFEAALRARIDHYRPGLVVLAGFMRVLSRDFVEHYAGRLLNIHPSLLPAFPGLDTHARALAAGVREHGASVHFVTPEVDAGPVIIQARVPVSPDDTPETLAARVLKEEHRIYPTAIRWFAEGRLQIRDGQVLLDGRRHPDQGLAQGTSAARETNPTAST